MEESTICGSSLFPVRPGSYFISISKANCRAICYHISYFYAHFSAWTCVHVNLLYKENDKKSLLSHCMRNCPNLQ